jgi:hypothetical protein
MLSNKELWEEGRLRERKGKEEGKTKVSLIQKILQSRIFPRASAYFSLVRT